MIRRARTPANYVAPPGPKPPSQVSAASVLNSFAAAESGKGRARRGDVA
jgi:hypothetical protein